MNIAINLTNTIAGYRLVQELYSGSRTLVYRGIREKDQQPVVIKLLRKEYPSFHELLQFRNQYTIAKNLHLPGIVVPYGLESYGHSYALVMEDCGGVALTDYLKTHVMQLQEFLEIAIQLADILYELYRHRVIHKDIKPANILIHPQTKQIKLIDFSIASLLPRETQEIQNPNVLEGTLAYISPEQTGRMNRGIDYRTDFYSLGVTFYELLTGTLPFHSDDPMELLHCHIAKKPPSLEEIVGKKHSHQPFSELLKESKEKASPNLTEETEAIEIPEVIANIVMKLMAKNAEDRYQSALGLKYDLEKCLTQLQQTGTIETFEIAQRDICDRFIIPEKLYGREAEVQTLLDAFERVSQGSTEIMLVAGYSGIGKTAVVNEIHKPIVRQRGYFIKGKFDQFNRNIPLSAFVHAFRDLMSQLLSESDTQLAQWKAKILAALGENGQVMIEVIPELEKIIGPQPPAQELSGTAAQNRFNLLFGNFISIFTTKDHPLVMFLDDLQWADSASLKLMQLLVGDSQTDHLLLIGAYRDNEVSAAHPLLLTLEEVKKAGATINTITLAPLSPSSLNQLVAETLSCSFNLAEPLTELVAQKTQGNPFFVTQFLKALHQDGLITFDIKAGYWQCHITKVREAALTDDVVEFMAQQLQKLPLETQSVLKLAACIGNEFDLTTLAIVAQQAETESATALWRALQEGLVVPQNEVYKFYVGAEETLSPTTSQTIAYRFLHDRVQQAGYSLIPEDHKKQTHLKIGQLLLQNTPPEERKENIFTLVNQLNYGIDLLTLEIEKNELAQLNLIASQKARAATAYQAAEDYATTGLTLLGETAWHRHYEMTLALHELAAEVAWLCAEFEQMDRWIAATIDQAKTSLDQTHVYQVKIQSLNSRNQFLEALNTGKFVLQLLGVNLPESPTNEDIQQARDEINTLIGDRSIESLFDLPKMSDPYKLAIMQIVDSILPSCYLTGSPLYPLVVALQVKLSIQFGNCVFSPISYVSYAFLLNMLWQDIEQVQQFGKLAYQLAKEPDAKSIRASTFNVFAGYVHHCTAHLRETLPIFQEGYQAGLETGDLEFMVYLVQMFSLNAFWTGLSLSDLEPQIRAYHQHLQELNIVTTAKHYLIYWETALILLGHSEEEVRLRQASYEVELLSQVQQTKDVFRLCIFYHHRFMLNFWLGEISQAQADAVLTRQHLPACLGTILEPVFYFYDSLTALATLSDSGDHSNAGWQQIAENQAKLQQWAQNAPMNHQHKYYLVEAEKYRVLGQKVEAIESYDLAIQAAKENDYPQEEAIANELAAQFYLAWGKEKIAQAYMQEAYYGYARWGAKAKTEDLEKRYPHLLKPILQPEKLSLNPLETISTLTRSVAASRRTSSSAGSTSISDALDFASILKAGQAISSNIHLDQLIVSLTRILLESSGAKKSALILPQNNIWQIKAITSIQTDENASESLQTQLESQPLDTCQSVPTNVIYYVKNTLQKIVIDHLQTNLPGLMGKYMLTYQPRSVFCLPVVNQGRLIAIVYLENQHTSGVFTDERLQVIQLLAAQAAIALENAQLYQQAQQALQDLQQAQLQIVQSEKMSALGNLVAGVAHEMNNPLGFIAASLQQITPTLADITEHLRLYQNSLPAPNQEILAHAEEIDLEYSLEDLPKITNSMTMACDRLKNISKSLRTFSRADQDYKVPFNIHDGIDSTLLILKHRLKATNERPAIEVVTNYGNLPPIHCFPGQLNQVFMNILANAIDALEEANLNRSFQEIKTNPNRLKIQTSLQNQDWVKIQIVDNGIGMNESVKAHIFDHLFTTKIVGKGTGLGLAIAYQIVTEKHGGIIEVESQLGKGTVFVISLPVQG